MNCVDCNKEFEIQKGCLKRRRERPGEPICPTCYRQYSKGGKYGLDYYPEKLRPILNKEVWDYDVVKEFLPSLRTKKKIRFVCQECNNEDVMAINSMHLRKICGIKPICKRCSLKYATSSDIWREHNSKAQLIAQNRPEVIKKQRDAQLRLIKSDPLYAEKRCSKSYISGIIRGFRFDSSWELYFLVHCWNDDKILDIQRYNGYIDYFDNSGVKRKYYPDFVVTYSSGKKRVIEIKGSKKYNNFHEKFNAARAKLDLLYMVVEESDLASYGIHFRRESYLKNFYKKHYHEIVFYDNKKTRAFKKRIEEWLK